MSKILHQVFFFLSLLCISSSTNLLKSKLAFKSFANDCKRFYLVNSKLNMPLYIKTNEVSGSTTHVGISLDGSSSDKWCITSEGYLQQQDGLYLDFKGRGKECMSAPFGYNCDWNGVVEGVTQPDQEYYILRWKLESGKGFNQFRRVVASFTSDFNGYLCATKNGYVGMCDLSSMDKNQLWIVDYNIKK